MSGRILQLNFKFNVPREDYESAVQPLADPIAATPGLIWKVWLMNEQEHEAGGIYLFSDVAKRLVNLQSPVSSLQSPVSSLQSLTDVACF